MKIRSSKISFSDLNVLEIANNSGVFIGRNRQVKWNTAAGSYSGFGRISGNENEIAHTIHLVLHEHVKKEKGSQQTDKGSGAP
ncbi:hypothetical protein ACK1LH_15340 [Metabacillus indicus]|uniref:Uncharacterized protein n=1 Tax=Metabacillus indicus TaxID=246786 RepID=A0A084GX28_METID|nr:hypothetical protein [Metabacillus indicus]KEZ51890.1 hypothetical protein GS18_0212350 [Metabacillus indicus]